MQHIGTPGLHSTVTGIWCLQSPFEQDFPTLAGRSSANKPWLSGNASAAEQPWTRLADAPEGGTLSPRGPSPGPPPSPRLGLNLNSQVHCALHSHEKCNNECSGCRFQLPLAVACKYQILLLWMQLSL